MQVIRDVGRVVAVVAVPSYPIRPQLSESESFQLFMRSASVAFLFEHAWLLAPKQHGKYLHILKDLMEKLGAKAIKPVIAKVGPLPLRIKLSGTQNPLPIPSQQIAAVVR
eukprot:jgi/Bigna1/143637/aug1.80_g18345